MSRGPSTGGRVGAGIITFLQRNALASDTTGRTAMDSWHQYLQHSTGLSGTVIDLEKVWLRAHGGSGETQGDLWNSYLSAKGFTGSFADKYNAWIDHGTP